MRQNEVVIPPSNIPVPVPDGWSATVPDEHDVRDLTRLLHSHETTAIGSSGASVQSVAADVSGKNETACAHMMVRDANGAARGWASVHDRAAGRVLGAVTIDPELDEPTSDTIAASLAKALSKEYAVSLHFCFEKRGVLEDVNDDNSVIEKITLVNYGELKESGIIADGMLPKLENAFEALQFGVDKVIIEHALHINEELKTTLWLT